MENLFIYGTLMDPEVQKQVIGRTQKPTTDVLEGYRKLNITISDERYPIVVRHEEGKVDGQVIELTEQELKAVDEYETQSYRRVNVTLKSGKNAWVFVKPLLL